MGRGILPAMENRMNARSTPAPFDLLKAEAFIRGENTLAVVSERNFDDVAARLEASVGAAAFALVHVHDLGEMLQSRGLDLGHRCRVYEVFNAALSAQLLALDPGLAHTLPCRIAMHDQGGVVTVSTPMPTVVMAEFSHAAPVARLARTIEAALQRMLRAVQ